MAHHAALAPNSPDGSRPPAKSLFRTLWTSSPLPHLCPRPPDQLICRNAPVGHHAEDLVPASVGQLHSGERKLHLPLHSRQRLFDQPLPGSYEPILRAVLGVPYPVGHEVHISPLLTPWSHTMLPKPCGIAPASLARRPRTPHGRNSVVHVDPNRKTRSPRNRSSSTLRAVPQQLPLVPRRIRPQHHLLHPPQADGPSASINTRNC